MVQFCVRNMGQSPASTCCSNCAARAAGPASRTRCARPCAAAGWLPGTLLPSSRALAAELALARNTVADAYGQLVAEGWLTARQGAGTRVAGSAGPPPGAALEPRPYRPATKRGYDLSPGVPDLVGVPARRLAGRRPQGADRRAERRPGLPGPGRAARAAPDAGPLPGPGPRRPRRPGEHRDLLRLRAGHHPAGDRAAGAGRRALAIEGYGLREHRTAITAAGLATPLLSVDDQRRQGQPAGRHRSRGRAADPGAPVPAGRAAGRAAPGHRAAVGQGPRRPGHRGRLRRRVPLRPAAAGRAAGPGARPGRVRGDGEQEPGPGAGPGLAGRPAPAG